MLKAIWFMPPALAQLAARGDAPGAGASIVGTMTTSSDEQFDALCAARQDFAVTAMDNVVMWNRRPGPRDFRIVAQVEATTFITLVARPDKATVADLAGGQLLVDSAENGFVIALRMMLADAGIAPDGYRLIETGGVRERFDRLLAGEGDATLLGPPFVDLAEARGFRRLADADRAYPGFPGQGVIVRTSRLGDIGDRLAGWLATLDVVRQAARADPPAAVASLVAGGLSQAAASVMLRTIGGTLCPDPAGVALLVDQRRRLGLPGGNDEYDALVDCSLLSAR